jgi:hypothetical protein
MSLSGMLFTLAILAFVITIAIKLVPSYVEFSTVKSVMETVKDQPEITGKGQRGVLGSIGNKLYINGIEDVTQKDFSYKKVPSGYELSVAYEVRKPLFGNLDAVMSFSHQVTIFGQ